MDTREARRWNIGVECNQRVDVFVVTIGGVTAHQTRIDVTCALIGACVNTRARVCVIEGFLVYRSSLVLNAAAAAVQTCEVPIDLVCIHTYKYFNFNLTG